MNWLDLLLLLTIAWFTIAGATAGLVRESLTLVAMLLGAVLAGVFYNELAMDIEVLVSNERTANIVAFAAIFFAVFGAGQILSVMLKGLALGLTLGPLDHPGGLVAGLLKALIIIEAGLFLFARYHVTTMVDAMDASLLTPFFLDGFPFLLTVLPGDFRAAVERFPAATGV